MTFNIYKIFILNIYLLLIKTNYTIFQMFNKEKNRLY